MRLHHVQLAIPAGSEAEHRAFWTLLGLRERPKPRALAARGGLWLVGGTAEIHLGVEEPHVPARKAHPALAVPNLDRVAERLDAAGHAPLWDDGIPGLRRFYVQDPSGNRIEILEAP